MVEKTVNICDICKEKVAKGKCDICNKDTCEDCNKEKMIGSMVPFLKYYLCSRCEDVIEYISINEPKIFEEVIENKPEIKQAIVEVLKNIIMLKKITDDDLPSKKKKSPFGPMLPPIYAPPTLYPPSKHSPFKKKYTKKQPAVDEEFFYGGYNG